MSKRSHEKISTSKRGRLYRLSTLYRLWILVALLSALSFGLYLLGAYAIWAMGTWPEPSTVVYDTRGERIGEILNSAGRRHEAISELQISDILIRGLIELEDRNFREHAGVSPSAILRSTFANIRAGSVVEGGSTLTMGLARNILGINRERSFGAKAQEVVLALGLELRFTKDEILKEYVNRIEFPRISVGVESVARSFFGKKYDQLTDAEKVAILTMVRNPRKYDPIREPEAFEERFQSVVNVLVSRGVISQDTAHLIIAEPLVFKENSEPLPYVTDALKNKKFHYDEGLVDTSNWLRVTVDATLTNKVQEIAESVRRELQFRNVSDFGVLMVERGSNKVRVLIGGANYQGEAGQVSAVFAPRQVGSTIKPFTYLLALKSPNRHMSDTIVDAPVSYATVEWTPYEPKNYSLTYRWAITLAEALAGSVNIPAVKIAEEVGVPRLLQYLQDLGISTLTQPPEHYGLALTLGVGEISLWELLRAYTIFAYQGSYCDFVTIENAVETAPSASPENCVNRAPPEDVAEIVETLSNRGYKLAEFSAGSALDFEDKNVFVKTGTSRNFRDNYAIGMTEKYLIAVWTGNKDGSNMRWVSGASGAGEIFAKIVHEFDAWNTGGIQTVAVQKVTAGVVSITKPLRGARYIIDTGRPLDSQTFDIAYWADVPHDSRRFLLNGVVLESSTIELSQLTPGNHTVEIVLLRGGMQVGYEKSEFSLEANE